MSASTSSFEDVWRVQLMTDGCEFNMLFKYPPIRRDLEEAFLPTWRALPKRDQDLSFSLVVLLQSVPIIPWIGKIEQMFGHVICKNVRMHVNDPARKES